MAFRLAQSENTRSSIRVTLLEMETFVRPLQPANAAYIICSTPSGMVRLSNASQPENAPVQIQLTELGIVTLVMAVQPSNAASRIEPTPSGIMMLLRLVHR